MGKSKKRSKKVDTKEAENSGSTVTDTKKGEIASVSGNNWWKLLT